MESLTPRFIPDHLIEQTFLRLPAKSLIRFQCLSKSWFDVINVPSFARAHLQHNRTNLSIVATRFHKDDKRYIIDWNPHHPQLFQQRDVDMYNNGYFDVVGSCDGILCIKKDSITTSKDTELVFWNPTFKKHKTLTVPTHRKNTRYCFAFGYDSSINDYKVVKLTSSYDRSTVTSVRVLKMKSNQWRRVDNLPRPWIVVEDIAVSLKGAVYWDSYRLNGEAQGFIIRFDLSKETFTEISLPVELRQMELVSELQGELCCTARKVSDGYYEREIWVWKDESWVKMYRISELRVIHAGCFIGERGFLNASYLGSFYVDMELENNQNLWIPVESWRPDVTCAQSLVLP